MVIDILLGLFFLYFLGQIIAFLGYILGVEKYPKYINLNNFSTPYFLGKSNNDEKLAQEKSTLASHDDSFISGIMWSDVGRE